MLVAGIFLLSACNQDLTPPDDRGLVDPGNPNALEEEFLPTSAVLNGYAGLGSFWTLHHHADHKFVISKRESRREEVLGVVVGTWESQASGFVKLTAEHGTGIFKYVTAGESAFGLEVPGTVFILKPPGSNELIYMPALGHCPQQAFVSSAMAINPGMLVYDTASDPTDLIGIVNVDPMSGGASIDVRTFGAGVSESDVTPRPFDFDCDQGELTIGTGSSEADGILTESGVGVVDTNGGVLLLPQDTTVTLADLHADYVGLVYVEHAGNTDEIFPIELRVDNDGTTAIAQRFSSVEGIGALSDSTFNVAIGDLPAGSPPGGFMYSIHGDLSRTSTGFGYLFAASDLAATGRTFLAGVGQQGDNESPYFMFVVQR